MNAFIERYASMAETELRAVAEDVKNLVPEAREALHAEFVRRHLSTKSVNWKAQPPQPHPRYSYKSSLVGDAAGEYREIWHGKYHAWIHVVVAFILQVTILGALFAAGLDFFAGTLRPVAFALGFILAAVITVLIYWDRWRCIEAYASQSCSGILNFSILYVPLVALFYANYRGVLKLRER